jgi:hypothetical protein
MAIKYTNNFPSKALKNVPSLGFLVPSGSPGGYRIKEFRDCQSLKKVSPVRRRHGRGDNKTRIFQQTLNCIWQKSGSASFARM